MTSRKHSKSKEKYSKELTEQKKSLIIELSVNRNLNVSVTVKIIKIQRAYLKSKLTQ